MKPEDLREHARWLISESAHREPLKLGVVLLTYCGDLDDLPVLRTLAYHDEFTLFAAVAAGALVDDPCDLWWDMARNVEGWGKVHLVERLAQRLRGRDDIQEWLLRQGCDNDVMPEYLAWCCATAGDLAGALAAKEIDDPLLDGACNILGAMIRGGPAKDIDEYEDGPVALTRLLGHLRERCTTLERLEFVQGVRLWLEWPVASNPPDHLAQIFELRTDNNDARREEVWRERETRGWTEDLRWHLAEEWQAILDHEEWGDRVIAAYLIGSMVERQRAWNLAPAVGVDLWNVAFQRLQEDPLDATLYWDLMRTDDLERARLVLDFAEMHLPLDHIATGPGDRMGMGDEFGPHHCLNILLQEMRRDSLYNERLVATGLRSSVITNRNMAVHALERHKRDPWGTSVEQAFQKSLGDETNSDVRERLVALRAFNS